MQRLRRLMARRSCRLNEGCFVAEGAKVLGEALAAGSRVESVYVDPAPAGPELAALLARCLDAGSRVFELDEGVLERVAGTVTPQPVLAVVGDVDITLGDLGALGADLVVVCVDVRDPGNAGTVLRSAEAAGAGGIIFCDGSVDVYNPKTVRASAGAVFHIPLVAGGEVTSVLETVSGWGLHRVGTAARRGRDYTDMDLGRATAVVIGNEATGLPAGAEAGIDEWLSIPMVGRAESLNVGMAATLVCFEAARQRRATGAGSAG
ncbi:MAG: RNA methyltransferase [Actinomycetota bacterium]|nr:RNA methyltransferase [Actinomycetota bacterium]